MFLRGRPVFRRLLANKIDHFVKTSEILTVTVNALDRDSQGVVRVEFPDERRMQSVELKIPGALPGEKFAVRVSAIRPKPGGSRKINLKPVLEVFNRQIRFIRPGPGQTRPVCSDLLDDRKAPSSALVSSFARLVNEQQPLIHCHYAVQRIWKLRNFKNDLGPVWNKDVKEIEPGNPFGSMPYAEIFPDTKYLSPAWTKTVRTAAALVRRAMQTISSPLPIRKVIIKHGQGSDVLVHFVMEREDSSIQPLGERLLGNVIKSVYASVCRSDRKENELLGSSEGVTRLVAGISTIRTKTGLSIGPEQTPSHSTHEKLLQFISESVKDCRTVWDVSAGPGSVSAALAKQGKVVVAIEPSEGRIETLRALERELGIRVIQGDINHEGDLLALIAATQRHKAMTQLTGAATENSIPTLATKTFYQKIEALKTAQLTRLSDDVKAILLAEGMPELIKELSPSQPQLLSYFQKEEEDKILLPDEEEEGELETGVVPSLSVRETSKELADAVLQTPEAVIVSFPAFSRETWRKGMLSKEARRFFRSSGVRKLIITSDDGRALKRDLGHLRLLGYELEELRLFDTQPHSMRCHAAAVLVVR